MLKANTKLAALPGDVPHAMGSGLSLKEGDGNVSKLSVTGAMGELQDFGSVSGQGWLD